MYLWWKAHFLPQGNFQMLTGMELWYINLDYRSITDVTAICRLESSIQARTILVKRAPAVCN